MGPEIRHLIFLFFAAAPDAERGVHAASTCAKRKPARLSRIPKLGSTPATGVAGRAPRPALRTTSSSLLAWNFFERPTFFREARKTAPGAGALPFPFRTSGLFSTLSLWTVQRSEARAPLLVSASLNRILSSTSPFPPPAFRGAGWWEPVQGRACRAPGSQNPNRDSSNRCPCNSNRNRNGW